MVKRVETYFGNIGISPLVTTLIRELENIDSWDVTQEGNYLVMHRESTTIQYSPIDMYWLYVYMGRKEIHLSFEERSAIYETCTEIRKQFLAKSAYLMDTELSTKKLITELTDYEEYWELSEVDGIRFSLTKGAIRIVSPDEVTDSPILFKLTVDGTNVALSTTEIIKLSKASNDIRLKRLNLEQVDAREKLYNELLRFDNLRVTYNG